MSGLLAVILLVCLPQRGWTVQQFQGVCARVKIEILQEMTLERIGFLATLKITNNESEAPITDFSAALTFENPSLSTEGDPHDASGLFFVQPPELEGIDAVDGSGSIPATTTAVVRWFIIPRIDAGGVDASGLKYRVGAALSGAIFGQAIDPETLRVLPDMIVVKPEPQLEITYFQPRDVDGDDPFTEDVVESPIPFTLGVLVKNAGYGLARQVKIKSQQPRIVENQEGLLLIAQLLGARIDDQPTDETSLSVNLGNIEPARCRKGAWDMITSLSGEFVEFNASYSHASELGGEDTSIITDLNAYFIAHEVINDLPGRDRLLDFLADTDDDAGMIPDTLYESDCNVLPVNHLTGATVVKNGPAATVTVQSDREDWVYLRVDDPGQAKSPIQSVVRSDGKVLNPNNYWTHIRYDRDNNAKRTYLNLFDFVSATDYQYQVTYAPATTDTQPPETRLRFSGQSTEADGRHYILPSTQIYFTVEDAGPTGTWYRLDGDAEFQPAYPFSIAQTGEHSLTYYSQDQAGNQEVHQAAQLIVSAAPPGVENLSLDRDRFFITGDLLAARPDGLQVQFEGIVTAGGLDAEVDIYRGVVAWPTLLGVPSSPNPNDAATLTVGGNHVDFYQYRLGDDPWSDEFAATVPIALSGLSAGHVDLYVNARNANGGYLPPEAVLHATWEVDPSAPVTEVTALQATPSGDTDNAFEVTGIGLNLYRYSLDGSYYRPETDPGTDILLTRLAEGQHALAVIGRIGQEWQAEDEAATLTWRVDRGYGYDFSDLARVRHVQIDAVDDRPSSYRWDGRNDAGNAVPAGWYTVRLTVRDDLGRLTYASELVRIDDLSDGGSALAGGPNVHQRYPRARGRWAVWQDQQNGDWDVYALDLLAPAPTPTCIAQTSRNQERPQTDGRYMVWEERQADGNRDIWIKELGTDQPAGAVTVTPDTHERHPAVDYPWIVYETQPVNDPNAPWQLVAHHMIDHSTAPVDPSGQDQLYPSIHRQRVVWQDFRDPGWGEVYLKDLMSGEVTRITHSIYGQYFPVVRDQWIVWSDNRDTQLDLYGFNLNQGRVIRLTRTNENETRPHLNGDWVVYAEDALGDATNLRQLFLPNLARVQLTNTPHGKEMPALASGQLVWEEIRNGSREIMTGPVPHFQAVFRNQNCVLVTQEMVDFHATAHTLLERWQAAAGVTRVTRFTALAPAPVSETVSWEAGHATGADFDLMADTFLWIEFGDARILDLGDGGCEPVSMAQGINVLSYCCFPDDFSAYQLISDLGKNVVKAVRMLDAATGRWVMASVSNGSLGGENFTIPKAAVLMLEINSEVPSWKPWE